MPDTTRAATGSATELSDELRARLIARARELELPGTWEPPPGAAIDHYTSGFAKTLCSNVFISGLEPDDAIANMGGFTAPFAHRDRVVSHDIDRATETVRLTLDTGVVRTARRYGSQGCITHPLETKGSDTSPLRFSPSAVKPQTPDPASTPWPMGDVLPNDPPPAELNVDALTEAMALAMAPDGRTLGCLVTYRGQIVAEEYGDGVDLHTPFESWSMGKSVVGTLMARLIQQGEYGLWDPAPIPEWQNDARRNIRIADIMRMSSGIRAVAEQDAEYTESMGYPDHLYFYVVDNAFKYAATRPQQWAPNTVGRYRNCDPVLASYLIRLAVEARGDDYHAFPQRALFDPLGISHFTLETDPTGNFLAQGYDFGTSRDWARLANLYLQDGVWQGERLLPEGYVDHALTVAPAWAADGRPIYGGGFLWKNIFSIADDHAVFAGAGGQYAVIIPSRQLVMVRHGQYSGMAAANGNMNAALRRLVECVPRQSSPGG